MSNYPALDELMDFYLAENRRFREREPQSRGLVDLKTERPVLRASSLGSCLASQHRLRHGDVPEREFDARTLRTFHNGDIVGDAIVKMCRRLGLTRYGPEKSGGETKLTYDQYGLTGHVDMILSSPEAVEEIPVEYRGDWSEEWVEFLADMRGALTERYRLEPGHIVVVELKTTHSNSLRYLHKDGKPRFNNGVQAGAYKLMGDTFPEQLPPHESAEYRIEYIGKDSFGMLSFNIGDDYANEALRRAEILTEAEGGPLDSVPCSCAGWEVEYCTFVELEGYDDKNVRYSCCRGAGHYERKRKSTDIFV